MLSDARGNPLNFLISPGQAHESKYAETLLCGWQASSVLADRAFDGNPIRDAVARMGAEAVIPPHPRRKAPAPYDAVRYRARHAIENGFEKLKQFRSVATRYDKSVRSFAAQVAIACIMLWLGVTSR